MIHSIKMIASIVFTVVILSGCIEPEIGSNNNNSSNNGSTNSDDDNSGDDSSGDDNSGELKTGYFIDSAVSGIAYYTSNNSTLRYTDGNGRFEYNEGETVTFTIGSIEFPPVSVVGNMVTPYDIAGADPDAAPDNGANDESIAVALNIGRLLQTLDNDGDLNNGISITPAHHNAMAAETPVDFSFASDVDATLTNLIDELMLQDETTMDPRSIVSDMDAKDHIDASIENAFTIPIRVPVQCEPSIENDYNCSEFIEQIIIGPEVVLIADGDFTEDEFNNTISLLSG